MTKQLEWIPAKVGCHWTAHEFTISTRVSMANGKMILTYPHSGYVLTRNREEIGIYKTLKRAQSVAECILRPI